MARRSDILANSETLSAKARLDSENEKLKNSSLIKQAETLLDKEVLNDEKRLEVAKTCLLRYKGILDLLIPDKCFVMILTFLQPCDIDNFYHDHFRVGAGSLSAALSDILITDEMRAVVGGEELMVRLEVRYDDYIRVRKRLCSTGLQKSASVNNLRALIPPPEETDSQPLLNSLDLATTSTQDSSFTHWVNNSCTKQLVLKMRKTSQDLTGVEAKQEIAKHRVELQEDMVRGLQREVTKLTQELETAQKLLLDNKKEIEDLTGANKGMEGTIDELLADKTKLANKLAMMEEKPLPRKRDVGEPHASGSKRKRSLSVVAGSSKMMRGLSLRDEGGTSQVQQKEGTVITMTKASLIQHKKGGKRKTKMRHLGESSNSGPPVKQEVTSVLMVNHEYGTSHGGTSTTNRQVAQFLQLHGARVHSTALQASEEDKRCAKEDGVILHLPVQNPRDKRTPSLEWLTFDHNSHYPDIPQDLKCIVGHTDITSGAAKSIQENRCPHAKLVLFNHDIPEDTEYYKGTKKAMAAGKKMEDILEDAKNADAVFSLGTRIYDYFETKYMSLGESKPRQHFLFLPRPSPVFEAISVRPGGGQKVVLSVGRVAEVARALGEVAEKITNISLRVRGIDDWEASKRILEENLHSSKIKPTLLPRGTLEDIAQDMQHAHLVLIPPLAEPFGLVGLESIAAGIPVLISDKSGLADMIMDLIKEKKLPADMRHRIVKTSVRESDLDEDAREWARKIADTLEYSESEFDKAAEYKKKLLESKYWEESHQSLLRVCGLTD